MIRATRDAGAAAGLLLALLALSPAPGAGQEWLEMRTARQVSGVDSLSLRVEYGAGRLSVGPAEEGLLYEARMRWDTTAFRPVRDYERDDGFARVRLGLDARNGEIDADVDWDEFDLGSLRLGDFEVDEAGDMEVGLSRSVPTDLELVMGATRGAVELGGVPLTRLRIATGASEIEVSFDRPNPARMETLRIKAGAASLDVTGLGNARAGEIAVESAVGEVELDFTGQWARDARATVKTGLGRVTLRIPSSLGVKLQKSSLLSSFSGFGLEKADDGSYRSENWDQARHRLELEVDAAFGSIEVERVP